MCSCGWIAGHLQQLRNILDDREASANDKFVALELLKNANIAAGGARGRFCKIWDSLHTLQLLSLVC